MGMIALRIPDQLKKEMNRVKINWSDYIRHSISEVLESQRKRELLQKIHKLTEKHKIVEPGTAVNIIRQIRACETII